MLILTGRLAGLMVWGDRMDLKKLMKSGFVRTVLGFGTEDGRPGRNGRNPHRGIWLSGDMRNALDSIRRADAQGRLYEMDCSGYYEKKLPLAIMNKLGFYKAGCSAFLARTPEGHELCCRNYDFPHPDSNGNMTALNVVVRCAPEDGYRSIGIADALWLNSVGADFREGGPDDGKTDISLFSLLPYICMDGMNEKGLTVSILILDLKEGEAAVHQEEQGKPSMVHTILMRRMLDSCSDVSEAKKLAAECNLLNVRGMDFHIFVSDAGGNSAVFEWRDNALRITDTDVVTNFYVCSDDLEDYYRNGVFTEKAEKICGTVREYHWGFGHGYHRFNDIVTKLEQSLQDEDGILRPVMTEKECEETLQSVFQGHTLHTVIYDSSARTASVWLLKDMERHYDFAL